VQAVLAIPGPETLRNSGEPGDVLMEKMGGRPAAVRVLATAAQAGVDSVLVIWPQLDSAVLAASAESPELRGIR